MNGLNLIGRWRWKHQEKVAAAATTRTILSPTVDRKEIRRVERVMLKNGVTAASVCVISIERGGEYTEIHRETLTTLNLWYPISLGVILFGEDKLRYDFSSCIAADDLLIREAGETYEAPEGLF